MSIRWVFLVLILISCNSGDDNQLLQVNKESILHNNSSRIWVINSLTQKGVNHVKLETNQKDVMVFFQSGKVFIQPIATLGNYPEKYGEAVVSDDSKELTINFKKDNWKFIIESISESKIVLKHAPKSEFNFDIELIAYPESE